MPSPQSPHIVLLYAGLLTILFIALSLRTIRLRGRLQIAIGDAGNELMLRAMRANANFTEYVPLSLILIYLVEATGANPVLVHALGASVLLGRISHAFGVSQVKENFRFRMAGMVMTFTPMIVGAVDVLAVYAKGAGA